MLIYYKDKRNEWRWRVVSKNGKIVGNSGEGYKELRSAKRNVKCLKSELGKKGKYLLKGKLYDLKTFLSEQARKA